MFFAATGDFLVRRRWRGALAVALLAGIFGRPGGGCAPLLRPLRRCGPQIGRVCRLCLCAADRGLRRGRAAADRDGRLGRSRGPGVAVRRPRRPAISSSGREHHLALPHGNCRCGVSGRCISQSAGPFHVEVVFMQPISWRPGLARNGPQPSPYAHARWLTIALAAVGPGPLVLAAFVRPGRRRRGIRPADLSRTYGVERVGTWPSVPFSQRRRSVGDFSRPRSTAPRSDAGVALGPCRA